MRLAMVVRTLCVEYAIIAFGSGQGVMRGSKGGTIPWAPNDSGGVKKSQKYHKY